MYIHTKLLFKKRDDYVEVCVYYSRNGVKFRESTGVKILHKHITKNGDVSHAHPYYQADLLKIAQVQDSVECLIAGYIEKNGEKPIVDWLQTAYRSAKNTLPAATPTSGKIQENAPTTLSVGEFTAPPIATPDQASFSNHDTSVVAPHAHRVQARAQKESFDRDKPDHDIDENALLFPDLHKSARLKLPVLSCWSSFCAGKKKVYRSEGAMKRMNNAKHSLSCYQAKRGQQYPAAIWYTQEIVDACQFSLDELKYRYPKEVSPSGRTPLEELRHLTWEGAEKMYGVDIPEKVKKNIAHEMTFIEQMSYGEYFLTVYDIVRFARSKGILCQGRGSAANSTICYCLGITSVDPAKFDLLFERFISSARNEPPDIDVDFEHERREEVIQYIYNKYGRDRSAIVATVTQLHQRGAIRDVGKVMGLSVDTINRLSSSIWEYSSEWFDEERVIKQGLNPKDPTLKKVLELTFQFMGFPRQLGQHTGGFVITDGKITDLCPILNARMEDRTNIEWNKDDIDALGFLKIDVLALGMLTCIRKGFDLTETHYGRACTLANIPQDDPAVYEMISHADTIGVFQIESRAQMSMLPRMKPKEFYDLVIEVAIVRPGPIQGDMVHPYLRRRNGEEPVDYPSEELKGILGRTLGVPLFQEQAMKIAIVAAGFTPTEADQLRRSMATFKVHGMVKHFEDKLINGMMANGYTREYAQRVFKQLEGFGSYGFPESHAASFALLVYVSAWLKCYYPDVFAAALLNSLPMGFYQPAEIVIDARKHGVEVRPVDVNFSQWDNALEERSGKYYAIRLGFRQVRGMREEDAQTLIKARSRAFKSADDLRVAGLSVACLERLADADAFRSMGMDRRQALWAFSIKDQPQALFEDQPSPYESDEKNIALPAMATGEHVAYDYATLGLSLKAHPVSFVRQELEALRITPASELSKLQDGIKVRVAGLVLVRQRPGTASGVCFITIQDETGIANLVVWEKLFNKFRKEVTQSKLLMVEGKLQIEGEVIHVIANKCHDLSPLLRKLMLPVSDGQKSSVDFRQDKSNDSKDVKPGSPKPSSIQGKIFPEGRNFR